MSALFVAFFSAQEISQSAQYFMSGSVVTNHVHLHIVDALTHLRMVLFKTCI